MNRHADPTLVKLSAENLTLRQRLAQLERETKELRKIMGNRNQVIDRVTIHLNERSQNNG